MCEGFVNLGFPLRDARGAWHVFSTLSAKKIRGYDIVTSRGPSLETWAKKGPQIPEVQEEGLQVNVFLFAFGPLCWRSMETFQVIGREEHSFKLISDVAGRRVKLFRGALRA
ncbi:MAG TPA: hypothetical protein VN442_00290 [Bryobacteraceae bacterium]|nr:hypothetical protein [Bryobacteraceae bacterium]